MRFILFVLLAIVALASPAFASWDATGTGDAWSNASVTNGTSTLSVALNETANDFSSKVGAQGTGNISICFDDDIAAQAASSAAVLEVYWSAIPGGDSLLGYVALQNASDNSIVTLSSSITCVPYAPPGWYRFKLTTNDANQNGLITVQSSN